LLAVNPQFSPALNNLAWLYSENLGQLEKAYAMASRARELLPYDPSTADTLGWILCKMGQYPRASSLLQESADKMPDQPEIQYHLGMVRYMTGEEQPARAAFQRALQLSKDFPGNEDARRRLAVLSIDEQATGTEGRAALEKRVAEQPDDPVALARLAVLYDRDGNADKAAGAYQAVLKVNPKNVRVLVNLAKLYAVRLQDTQKAIELAKTVYKLAADDPEVTHTLGRLAYQTGDYKWAFSLLQTAVNKQPTNPEVLFDFAEAAYSLGQVADAQAAMQIALQAASPFSRTNNAKRFLDMLALSENPSQALAANAQVGQILNSEPEYVPALMVMAAISEQKSDVSAAKQIYEKVLSRYADFSPAQKRLAILLAGNKEDDQKTYALAMKARQVFPGDPDLAKVLGIVAFRQGDYARSASLLKESASKLNDNAPVFYYLGMSQYRLKQPAESKQSLQRALDLNLPAEMASEARRTLAELK
jgi:tetratricopeptide (TPR) repeat protein